MADELNTPEAAVQTPVEPLVAVPATEPVVPVISEEDNARFRQWARENIRWIADELWLHQTSVPMDERPIRNP